MKGFLRTLANKGWENLARSNAGLSAGLAFGKSLGSKFSQSAIGGFTADMGRSLKNEIRNSAFYRESGQHIVRGMRGFGKYTNDYYNSPANSKLVRNLYMGGLRSGMYSKQSTLNTRSLIKRARMAKDIGIAAVGYDATKRFFGDND